MKQKLIKLNDSHYIVVDDSEIKDVRPYKGRWHYEKGVAINQFPSYLTDLSECKLITHSTQPELLGSGWMQSVLPLLLSEVEEAIYGYSVITLANKHQKFEQESGKNLESSILSKYGYITGFNAHKELVKDKLFTVDDMKKAYLQGKHGGITQSYLEFDEFIQSLLSQTEWDVEFDEQGKLKLL